MSRLQWIENKIMTRDALVHHCNQWKAISKRIVFTNGCFDILHRGHLDYLAKAADLGNVMIIGLNTDASVRRLKGDGRPVNNEYDRAFQLAALMYVDAVCFFDEDTPAELIKALSPHVLAKGGDYTVETIIGADTVLMNGGKVEVIPFVEGYSTSALISSIKKL